MTDPGRITKRLPPFHVVEESMFRDVRCYRQWCLANVEWLRRRSVEAELVERDGECWVRRLDRQATKSLQGDAL